MPIALTYDEVVTLKPCDESFKRVAKLLGGKKGWNSHKIDAAKAREAGCTFDDLVWVASALSRTDKDVEHRLRLWMADCAARVLHIYEKTGTMVLHKSDNRPNRYGGTNYRTLCGRTNARCDDGMNVAESDDRVTCKFCLQKMAALAFLSQPAKGEREGDKP